MRREYYYIYTHARYGIRTTNFYTEFIKNIFQIQRDYLLHVSLLQIFVSNNNNIRLSRLFNQQYNTITLKL